MEIFIKYTKQLIPPIFLDFIDRFRNRHFVGNYDKWEDALKDSTGDYSELLEGVKNSLLKVNNGEGEFERDSVLIYEPQYNWPLLAILLKAANYREGSLAVLDFGGSLGTVYFQNRKFLSSLRELSWCIVEQPSFVNVGREYFQNDELTFHCEIDEFITNKKIHLILVSGVLQYLRNPYEILNELLDQNVEYVVIDRTPFILSGNEGDLLTVQKLSPQMHSASFPHWFFGKNKFIGFFYSKDYTLLAEYDAYKCDRANIKNSKYCGLIFVKNKANNKI